MILPTVTLLLLIREIPLAKGVPLIAEVEVNPLIMPLLLRFPIFIWLKLKSNILIPLPEALIEDPLIIPLLLTYPRVVLEDLPKVRWSPSLSKELESEVALIIPLLLTYPRLPLLIPAPLSAPLIIPLLLTFPISLALIPLPL